MLANKAARFAAIAILACVASGLTHGFAAIVRFYRPIDPRHAWIGLFSMAAFIVGIGAGIVAHVNAPAKPMGWRPGKPWAAERLAPATVYLGLMILALAMYHTTDAETSQLIWKISVGTSSQFAFALLVWENWWIWREFTPSMD